MTRGKDAGLVDDGMEEKEDDVHGRGGRGVGSRSSVILTALVVGETKALLEPVTGVVIVGMLSGKELKA